MRNAERGEPARVDGRDLRLGIVQASFNENSLSSPGARVRWTPWNPCDSVDSFLTT